MCRQFRKSRANVCSLFLCSSDNRRMDPSLTSSTRTIPYGNSLVRDTVCIGWMEKAKKAQFSIFGFVQDGLRHRAVQIVAQTAIVGHQLGPRLLRSVRSGASKFADLEKAGSGGGRGPDRGGQKPEGGAEDGRRSEKIVAKVNKFGRDPKSTFCCCSCSFTDPFLLKGKGNRQKEPNCRDLCPFQRIIG